MLNPHGNNALVDEYTGDVAQKIPTGNGNGFEDLMFFLMR
jgi:hypothetical protein